VADLYCGTGTLGIEALSRGAKFCGFAEYDRRVVGLLKRNLDELRLGDRARLWVGDVTLRLQDWLVSLDVKLDLAFVDPPYEQARTWDWSAMEAAVFSPLAKHLAADGIVTLRAPTEVVVPDVVGGLAVIRRRSYGDMGLCLLRLANDDCRMTIEQKEEAEPRGEPVVESTIANRQSPIEPEPPTDVKDV
jgi:16S rRNA (guanine966-N2)-methyltransferase